MSVTPTSSSSTFSNPLVPAVLPAVRSTESLVDEIVDRRGRAAGRVGDGATRQERRQFGSSHSGLSANGRELAAAIDAYKIQHHRRYITCDEMLVVLQSLGYDKAARPLGP